MIREVIETMPAMAWSVLPDGSNAFVNRQWAEYTGLSAEQTAESGWRSTVHPEDASEHMKKWHQSLTTGQPFEHEVRLRRTADGQYRWFLVRGMPLRDGHDEILKWYGIAADIEGRKRAEEALRANEHDLNLIINTIPVLSWSARPDGSADFFNQLYLDFVGLSLEQTQGWGWTAAVHPDDLNGLAGLWQSIMASGKAGEAEARLRRFDGEYRWFLFRANPLRDESGNIVKWFGVNTDITERKRAEEELRRSEASLLEAQRLSHMGSWRHDVASGTVIVSPEIYRIFGVQPYEDTSSAEFWLSRNHPEDQQRIQEYFEKCEIQKTEYESDYRIVLPDGTIKHLHAVGHPVVSQSGELVEMIGTAMDVTEHKRAEEERERLRQLETDLAHMNRVTMLGELASSLAHELNQPIAAAITSANACLRWLAHNPPDLERARAAATRIENDGSRAAEIIQRLRAFYKTGTPPKRELVDLNQVAGEILELLRDEAERHSISLYTELAPQLPKIMADRVQLQQVLMNLLLNGIEAMTDGAGRLILRSQSAEGGLLLISVSDTGVGLPSEKLDRLFSAFYTTKPQGTGMGLAISRSIIEAHGGRLWATANAEHGATFHFTLPTELEQ